MPVEDRQPSQEAGSSGLVRTDPTPHAARGPLPDTDAGGRRPAERSRGARRQEAPATAGPTRLLVADDDNEMRRTLAATLRRDGYVVIEADDGDDVVDYVRQSDRCVESGPRLDAVLSDVRMPGPSGLGVLMAIRAVAPALPVVLITAFGDAELHLEARARGASAMLDKPFGLDELRATLEEFAPPL